MAMKDNELVIWNEVHPSYTLFHKETETFSSLWSHFDGNIHHFQNVYAEDVSRYGDNLAYWPKEESRENIFSYLIFRGSVLAVLTSTSLTCGIFAPMFTFGKYYNRDEKSCCLSPFRSIILFVMASM